LIRYRSGYKYQTVEDAVFQLPEILGYNIETEYISLTWTGTLSIRRGYAWDGASGPTIDTKNTMQGSLVHDALYQLMRERHLPAEFREIADRILQRILVEDGMSSVRAWSWYTGVNWGGGPSADPANDKVVLTAP